MEGRNYMPQKYASKEMAKSMQSREMAKSMPSRGSEVSLVPFTAQCVYSFGRLSQHGYAMWPPGN